MLAQRVHNERTQCAVSVYRPFFMVVTRQNPDDTHEVFERAHHFLSITDHNCSLRPCL